MSAKAHHYQLTLYNSSSIQRATNDELQKYEYLLNYKFYSEQKDKVMLNKYEGSSLFYNDRKQ